MGVREGASSRLNDHIRSVNFITLVWIPALILLSSLAVQDHNMTFGYLTFGATLTMVLIFFFNKHRNHLLSIVTFLITVNFNMILINVMLEFNYGTFLYLFPLFASVTYLFPLPRFKVNLAVTVIMMATVHLASFLFIYEFPSENFEAVSRPFHTTMNYGLAFLLTFVIVIQYGFIQSKQKVILDRTIKDNEKQHLLLEETLKDKTILLSEIHHRTKNNLAIVSSILNLQRTQIEDEQLSNVLLDCSNRVHSIAAVHQKLYEKGGFSIVDFKEYMGGLITDLQRTLFPKEKTITVSTEIESFDIKTDQAVSCALILNEVITNSIKYAFNGVEEAYRIDIRVSRISNQIILMVHDNGPGFDIERIESNKTSLGMSLIEALTEQLDGTYEYHNIEGTTFTLSFKLN